MTPLKMEQWLRSMRAQREAISGTSYRAMYSTWWKGIVTDPALMVVPVDDHMVHRGDGIFEAARVIKGAIFDLEAHLERLESSAQAISLKLPCPVSEIRDLTKATAEAARLETAALRLFVGRGPGSFSPNPYESPASQLYIIATEYKAVSESVYQEGAKAIISKITQKDAFFSRIKSCNYLPNVLMKREAVDQGVMFAIGCSPEGVLLEGPTENLAILNSKGHLLIPRFDYTLRGTTLLAVVDALKKSPLKEVTDIRFVDLKLKDIEQAQEAFMVGTTLEVLPLVELGGKAIGQGRPGPVGRLLRSLLLKEMTENSSRRTDLVLQ